MNDDRIIFTAADRVPNGRIVCELLCKLNAVQSYIVVQNANIVYGNNTRVDYGPYKNYTALAVVRR